MLEILGLSGHLMDGANVIAVASKLLTGQAVPRSVRRMYDGETAINPQRMAFGSRQVAFDKVDVNSKS